MKKFRYRSDPDPTLWKERIRIRYSAGLEDEFGMRFRSLNRSLYIPRSSISCKVTFRLLCGLVVFDYISNNSSTLTISSMGDFTDTFSMEGRDVICPLPHNSFRGDAWSCGQGRSGETLGSQVRVPADGEELLYRG